MLETDLDFHTHTTQAIYFKQPGWSYKKHVITWNVAGDATDSVFW